MNAIKNKSITPARGFESKFPLVDNGLNVKYYPRKGV